MWVENSFGFILLELGGPAAWHSMKRGGVVAVNSIVKLSRLGESNERWKRKKLLVKVRHEFSAPVTGITPSTQVGRLSGSHSDIGFWKEGERTAWRKVQEIVGA